MIDRVQPVHPVYGVRNSRKRYPNNGNNQSKKDSKENQKKNGSFDQLILNSREVNVEEEVKVLKR